MGVGESVLPKRLRLGPKTGSSLSTAGRQRFLKRLMRKRFPPGNTRLPKERGAAENNTTGKLVGITGALAMENADDEQTSI